MTRTVGGLRDVGVLLCLSISRVTFLPGFGRPSFPLRSCPCGNTSPKATGGGIELEIPGRLTFGVYVGCVRAGIYHERH